MKTIEVIPNPYSAIDADGVPQGVVGLPGAPGAWIGAALDAVASRTTGKCRFYFPGPNVRRNEKGVAGLRVVTLNVSDTNVRATIANAVLEGALIVVGKNDAAKLGIINDFLDAEKALEREKERALAAHRALKGDETTIGDVPHMPAKDEEGEDAAGVSATPSVERVTRSVTFHPSTEA